MNAIDINCTLCGVLLGMTKTGRLEQLSSGLYRKAERHTTRTCYEEDETAKAVVQRTVR